MSATPGGSHHVEEKFSLPLFLFTVATSLAGLVIRPEFRYDTAFSGGKPFDLKWDGSDYGGTKKDQFTFGLDVVIPFHL